MDNSTGKIKIQKLIKKFFSDIISYTLSHHPTNKMLNKTIKKSKRRENLVIPLYQVFQYQHSSWTSKLRILTLKMQQSRQFTSGELLWNT